jgi:hypothetical protein
MITHSDLENKRWIFMILELGFRLGIFQKLFQDFHFNSPFIFDFKPSMMILKRTRRFSCVYLDFVWRFEQRSLNKLLVLSMRTGTENKSVFDLLLLRTGLILLQLLFFSLLRTVIARIPWIGAWIAVTGSMMKITQVISENLTEFEPFLLNWTYCCFYLCNFRWILSVFVMNLVQLCVFLVNWKRLRWF